MGADELTCPGGARVLSSPGPPVSIFSTPEVEAVRVGTAAEVEAEATGCASGSIAKLSVAGALATDGMGVPGAGTAVRTGAEVGRGTDGTTSGALGVGVVLTTGGLGSGAGTTGASGNAVGSSWAGAELASGSGDGATSAATAGSAKTWNAGNDISSAKAAAPRRTARAAVPVRLTTLTPPWLLFLNLASRT